MVTPTPTQRDFSKEAVLEICRLSGNFPDLSRQRWKEERQFQAEGQLDTESVRRISCVQKPGWGMKAEVGGDRRCG